MPRQVSSVALTTGLMHSCALRHNWNEPNAGAITVSANWPHLPTNSRKSALGSTSTCGIDYDNALV